MTTNKKMIKKGKQFVYLFNKFINFLMKSGKKHNAEKIFFMALTLLKKKEKKSPYIIFLIALRNVMPCIDIKSVKRGGARYKIPVPLKEEKALSLSIKWIIDSARNKKGQSLGLILCKVLHEAFKNQGDSVKKQVLYKSLGFKNRSLSHYRWF